MLISQSVQLLFTFPPVLPLSLLQQQLQVNSNFLRRLPPYQLRSSSRHNDFVRSRQHIRVTRGVCSWCEQLAQWLENQGVQLLSDLEFIVRLSVRCFAPNAMVDSVVCGVCRTALHPQWRHAWLTTMCGKRSPTATVQALAHPYRSHCLHNHHFNNLHHSNLHHSP